MIEAMLPTIPSNPSMHLSLAGVAQIESDQRGPVPLATLDAVVLAWVAVEGPTRVPAWLRCCGRPAARPRRAPRCASGTLLKS
jgi:hypothetical protein